MVDFYRFMNKESTFFAWFSFAIFFLMFLRENGNLVKAHHMILMTKIENRSLLLLVSIGSQNEIRSRRVYIFHKRTKKGLIFYVKRK